MGRSFLDKIHLLLYNVHEQTFSSAKRGVYIGSAATGS